MIAALGALAGIGSAVLIVLAWALAVSSDRAQANDASDRDQTRLDTLNTRPF